MEEKKITRSIVFSIVAVLLLVIVVAGSTYAYFRTGGETSEVEITTGNIKLSFVDETEVVNASGIKPIYESEITTGGAKKTFTLTSNDSTQTQYVTLKLTDITIDPELSNSDFRWALYENNELLTTYNFDSINTGETVELLANLELEKNTTKTYDLYIYINENEQDQSKMMNKKFSAKISAEGYIERSNYELDNLINGNLTENKYLDITTGEIRDNTTNYTVSDYIEVDDNKDLFFNYITSYNYIAFRIAFYDENKTFISGTNPNDDYGEKVYDIMGNKIHGFLIDIPENAKYFVFNTGANHVNSNAYQLYYLDKNILKEYNLQLDYESSNTLAGLRIANFGDSIFGKYNSPNDISSYMNTYYGVTAYNVSFSGARMAQSSATLSPFSMYNLADSITTGDYTLQESVINNGSYLDIAKTHFETLKTIDFNNIDYITIALGTNDFGGNVVLENTNSLDKSTYIGAARYSINKIKEKYPNIKIILLTPIYRFVVDGVVDIETYTNTNGNYLVDFGNALKELKDEYNNNVYVYDGYNDLDLNHYNRYVYFEPNDGIHPHDNGIKHYAYKLGKFIESIQN